MKVLLDHNLPKQLKPLLLGHDVITARDMRWDGLSNGNLLASAEAAGFGAMVTGDQNLSYQQNNLKRTMALIVLTEIDRKLLVGHGDLILSALDRSTAGGYELVQIPNPKKSQR